MSHAEEPLRKDGMCTTVLLIKRLPSLPSNCLLDLFYLGLLEFVAFLCFPLEDIKAVEDASQALKEKIREDEEEQRERESGREHGKLLDKIYFDL